MAQAVRSSRAIALWVALILCSGAMAAQSPDVSVPARRIVTLSPHLAELVFSAGAGDRLVGVVEYSDFPPAVRRLPRVGDAFRVDYEALLALRPDLVLGWTSGNPPETLQRVRSLGLRVETLEPVQLADVGAHIERIGAWAGSAPAARAAAIAYRERLERLRAEGLDERRVRVFVQLTERPHYTVTDQHFLGQGLKLCGGENVFGALPGLTAIVGLEAILDARPEVIVASDMAAQGGTPPAEWQQWKQLPAVQAGTIYTLDADLLSRPGVRVLDGIEALCATLDQARRRLPDSGARLPQHLGPAVLAGNASREHE
jgi:iron complex transport system substrate-binding protein